MVIRKAFSTLRKMSKIKYPAPERNKTYILEVLKKHFSHENPAQVLEISSGTGQHVSFFAMNFPNLTFQPSEYDTNLFNSIRAYSSDVLTKNIKDPIKIDVTEDSKNWKIECHLYDYIININMIHITPFNCTVGLFRNASKVLKQGGLMLTYGPYAHNGIITPQSNVDFDKHLREQDPQWGLRDISDLEKIGESYGIRLVKIYDMPSNNKCLVWENSG